MFFKKVLPPPSTRYSLVLDRIWYLFLGVFVTVIWLQSQFLGILTLEVWLFPWSFYSPQKRHRKILYFVPFLRYSRGSKEKVKYPESRYQEIDFKAKLLSQTRPIKCTFPVQYMISTLDLHLEPQYLSWKVKNRYYQVYITVNLSFDVWDWGLTRSPTEEPRLRAAQRGEATW